MKLSSLLLSSFLALGLVTQLAFAQDAKPKVASVKAWDFPQNALFFKERADADWYEKPEEQREWLAPAEMGPEVFKALDMENARLLMRRGNYEPLTNPQQQKRIAEAALELWKQGVRPEWLPPLELIVPSRMNRTPPNPSYEVAHCPFQRGETRGLWMSTLDGEFWLYLEQPVSTAKTNLVRPADVLRPELFADFTGSRPAFTAREFTRTRAFLPNGDYQSVRILLIHCQLPQSLDFSNFAYPGTVTP